MGEGWFLCIVTMHGYNYGGKGLSIYNTSGCYYEHNYIHAVYIMGGVHEGPVRCMHHGVANKSLSIVKAYIYSIK